MSYIDFESRKIALIGIGINCKHFYMQFHSILDISYCFATRMNKLSSNMGEFFADRGVKYIPFEESAVRNQNLLLVMCVEHDFRKRNDKMLFQAGFKWGTDYIDSMYVVQFYRKKYNVQLENKGIWIFGAGNNGKKFYDTYNGIYRIEGFISNFPDETEFQGLPVIRPEEAARHRDSCVVICSDAEAVMAEQLEQMGYRGDRDYTFEGMLPKKLFIAIGTCQIERVAEFLKKNNKFSAFDICIYRDNMYASCSEADNRRLEGYGVFCDVVFYNTVNAGTVEQRNYEPVLSRYFPEAMRIYMPFYYFLGQLPQAGETENRYTVMYHEQYFWLRGDKEVNSMVENGYSMEEVKQKILESDYWTKEEIVKHFCKELKKIEIMDRFSTFPIKPFIENNYRDIMIFNDGTHFGCHLSVYLANRLAEYLNIEPLTDVSLLEEAEREEKSIMPVYPCVRQALEMNIKGGARLYNVEEKRAEIIHLEAYIEVYYKYIVSVRSINRGLGTIF